MIKVGDTVVIITKDDFDTSYRGTIQKITNGSDLGVDYYKNETLYWAYWSNGSSLTFISKKIIRNFKVLSSLKKETKPSWL